MIPHLIHWARCLFVGRSFAWDGDWSIGSIVLTLLFLQVNHWNFSVQYAWAFPIAYLPPSYSLSRFYTAQHEGTTLSPPTWTIAYSSSSSFRSNNCCCPLSYPYSSYFDLWILWQFPHWTGLRDYYWAWQVPMGSKHQSSTKIWPPSPRRTSWLYP